MSDVSGQVRNNWRDNSRDNQVRIRLNNKVYLLYKANPLKVGAIAILYDKQKQTQRVKQSEETEEYVQNKRIT